MKILHLITSLRVGGAESALVNYLSKVIEPKVIGTHENTHTVAYFHAGPNLEKLNTLGIQTYKISGLFVTYDFLFFWQLRKLIKSIQPDVIHSSLWSANIAARLIAKLYKIPIICDLHGNSFDEGKFRNWFDRKTVRFCSRIVAVSDSVKDSYSKNIIGSLKSSNARVKAQNNLVVIKNGIDVKDLIDRASTKPVTRDEMGLLPDDFVIGAVGRLEPIKSYDVLIKAFALFLNQNPEAKTKLCIVGDGSEKTALRDLAGLLKIEAHVVFTGFRPDAYKFYQLFDCFALSSQSEGLSIALLEAMAFGLPLISTNLDTTKHDVITPEFNGILVAINNLNDYATALSKLYLNRGLAHLMGARNKQLVQFDFSIKSLVDRYENLYLKITYKD